MLPIHIVGHAGCGKTTLIVDLIKALATKNIKVGTLKHSAHVHELDKPGKDSFAHRIAGAFPVTVVTEQMSAIYLPRNEDTTPEKLLATYYSNVDIVLIEGWISGPFQKIELFRKSIGRPPLFSDTKSDIKNVKAIVSDDPIENTDIQVFQRSNLDQMVNFILAMK
jgi:molybdopterin-guanine dinucleotide biosynthesis protein B